MIAVKNKLIIESKYLAQFEELCNKLSPENLACDGEFNMLETRRKEKKLLKVWKRLEKKIGRTVTEQEIWDTVLETYRQNRIASIPKNRVWKNYVEEPDLDDYDYEARD